MSCVQTVELQSLSAEILETRQHHPAAADSNSTFRNTNDLIDTLAPAPVPTASRRIFQANDVAPSAQVQDTARYGIVMLLVTANLIQVRYFPQ